MIANIKLQKITPAQLKAAVQKIEWFSNALLSTPTEDVKAKLSTLSILDQVIKKLWKRVIDKRNTEKFNISLKYYEANAVWMVLVNVDLDYDAQLFLNQLDQKLA